MFAGEATTPYHPSTIHGAFETGIREAYRLDLALEPGLSGGLTFDESFLYQPTFSVRRHGQVDSSSRSDYAASTAVTFDGRVSLEGGAATGCKKCIKELTTGEKRKDCHCDHCPRKMFGVAQQDAKERAVLAPPQPTKAVMKQPPPQKKATEVIAKATKGQPLQPPNISLLPGVSSVSEPAPQIGLGWIQLVVRRQKQGKSDRYYVTPEGKRIRGFAEVLNYLNKVDSGNAIGSDKADGGRAIVVGNDTSDESWWFDHDASILRGVESFGTSSQTMSKIKTKILAATSDTHTLEEMEDRYKSLLSMVARSDDSTDQNVSTSNEWRLPGRRGNATWLAAGSQPPSKRKPDLSITSTHEQAKKAKLENIPEVKVNSAGTNERNRRSEKRLKRFGE